MITVNGKKFKNFLNFCNNHTKIIKKDYDVNYINDKYICIRNNNFIYTDGRVLVLFEKFENNNTEEIVLPYFYLNNLKNKDVKIYMNENDIIIEYNDGCIYKITKKNTQYYKFDFIFNELKKYTGKKLNINLENLLQAVKSCLNERIIKLDSVMVNTFYFYNILKYLKNQKNYEFLIYDSYYSIIIKSNSLFILLKTLKEVKFEPIDILTMLIEI